MKSSVNPREIAIRDYDYPLPDERIAKYPLPERDRSKLLVWRDGAVSERRFYDLPGQVPAGSLMLFNNTRVIQARLHFRKASGALIEVFCLEPEHPRDYAQNFASTAECTWTCLVGNSKKWKDGELQQDVEVDGRRVTLRCGRVGPGGASQAIRFRWDGGVAFARLLEAVGELPIPPYLGRRTEESDKTAYQTVYSRIEGSVAAPTAGLHFTEAQLSALRAKGVALQHLTLHVGAGTFKPVKSETIEGHDMHTEFIAVPRAAVADILAHVRRQGEAPRADADRPRLVAVGTTSVRTVESLYYIGEKLLAAGPRVPEPDDLVVGQWEPYDRPHLTPTADALQAILDHLDATGRDTLVTATQILIAPGFRYRLVEAMVTNFHMPQSTLLLLVSAFVDGGPSGDDGGEPAWRRIYAYALEHGFRFLSYGDSSLLFRQE